MPQAPPPRGQVTSLVDAPRAATIHEYLDWTVTAEEASTDEELVRPRFQLLPRGALHTNAALPDCLGTSSPDAGAQDFGGFRVIVLLPRFKPGWPPPGAYEDEAPKRCKVLGAPRNPLPLLMPNGKPVCAATIRAGVRFLEVPFFATQETRRNRGFGRALLEARGCCCRTCVSCSQALLAQAANKRMRCNVQAIEEVARALGLPHLLLCSTDDPVTRNTWRALGFSLSTEQVAFMLCMQAAVACLPAWSQASMAPGCMRRTCMRWACSMATCCTWTTPSRCTRPCRPRAHGARWLCGISTGASGCTTFHRARPPQLLSRPPQWAPRCWPRTGLQRRRLA